MKIHFEFNYTIRRISCDIKSNRLYIDHRHWLYVVGAAQIFRVFCVFPEYYKKSKIILRATMKLK